MQLLHLRRTHFRLSPLPSRRWPPIALALCAALASAACGHDWDAYDPRLGGGGTTGTTGTGGSGASVTSGGGGAGGVTNPTGTGGTISTGGTGGTITGGTGGSTTSSTGGSTTSSTGGSTTSSTTSTTGPTCVPDSTQECYTGPAGTKDVGICKHGTQTCDQQGAGYGPCTGEVKPAVEECGDAIDQDCNSLADDHCATWAKRFGDSGSQHANGVATDSLNNVVVVGRAEETTNFGGQDLDAGGSPSAFVVKFTSAGAHVWSHLYGDASTQEATAVAIDTSNNVYVTGTFSGSITLDATTLTSTGGQDVFVAKLDSTGAVAWAKSISGLGTQNARAIAVDSNGNAYVAGSFTGATDFLGTQATANDQLDGYLVKVSTTGVLSWVKTFGGIGNDEATAVFARNDNVYFTGYFDETITLGGNVLNGASGVDVFVARLSTNGTFDLSKAYTTTGDQYPRGIAASGGGSIFVFGDFTQQVKFGVTLGSAGGSDVFLAKLDADGQSVWTHAYGDAADQGAGALSYDSSGDLALAIHHRGTFDYGGGPLAQAGSPPSGDMVVVKVSGSTGNHLWSRRFGDASDQDPRGVAHDSNKAVYLVGGLSGSANFGPGTLVSGGQDDVLVAKLAP